MTCLSTDTSIKSGGVKLVLWAQTSPLSEMTDAVMQVLFSYGDEHLSFYEQHIIAVV
jgi:hypothetical protein